MTKFPCRVLFYIVYLALLHTVYGLSMRTTHKFQQYVLCMQYYTAADAFVNKVQEIPVAELYSFDLASDFCSSPQYWPAR